MLRSSFEYRSATEEQKANICNGCGAAGAKFDFVPDSMWGLDICEACNIHDWDYHFGSTQVDKTIADRNLLHNCYEIIDGDTSLIGRCLRKFRRARARKYFGMVVVFGNKAYWSGKDRPVI